MKTVTRPVLVGLTWAVIKLGNLIKVHGFIPGRRHKPKPAAKKETRSARPWRRIREIVLQRDKYKCVSCGQVSADLEVDHIIPRNKGGSDLEGNLQSLCGFCHLIKTASENPATAATMFPSWMPRAHIPLVLVCGRPGAGKSTYVKENKSKSDLVIDLDLMANEMKRELHEFNKAERNALIRVRNERIAQFIRGETNYQKCWVVTAAGLPYQRDYWRQRGAEIVVIETPIEICERRIHGQDLPGWRKEEKMQAARNWQ